MWTRRQSLSGNLEREVSWTMESDVIIVENKLGLNWAKLRSNWNWA